MNKEKLIKNQALTSLKGSWIILIAMVLTISAVMIAIYSIGSIVQLITKSLDTATGMAKSGKEFTFTLISIIDLVVMFFLTPLINGFLNLFILLLTMKYRAFGKYSAFLNHLNCILRLSCLILFLL